MMRFAREFFGSLTSFKKIWSYKKNSIFRIILYYIFINFLMVSTLNFGIYNSNSGYKTILGIEINEETAPWFTDDLPDCIIETNQFRCIGDDVVHFVYKHFQDDIDIYMNVEEDFVYNGQNKALIFKSDRIIYTSATEDVHIPYSEIEKKVLFSDLKNMDIKDAEDVLFGELYKTVRRYLVLPLMISVTTIFLITNIIFLLIVVLLSWALKYGYKGNYPSFKGVLAILIYSSTGPAIVIALLGLSGVFVLTPIIYNFATPVIAYIALIKSTRNPELHSSDEMNK